MHKGNIMDSFIEIAEAIRYDIDLHKRLSEMVVEDSRNIEEDNPALFNKRLRDRTELEKEIENINRSIINLFLVSDVNSGDTTIERKKEIVILMNLLRETIKETTNIVNKAVAYIKKDKTETSMQLKKLNMGRKALSSYARYGTI